NLFEVRHRLDVPGQGPFVRRVPGHALRPPRLSALKRTNTKALLECGAFRRFGCFPTPAKGHPKRRKAPHSKAVSAALCVTAFQHPMETSNKRILLNIQLNVNIMPSWSFSSPRGRRASWFQSQAAYVRITRLSVGEGLSWRC